MLAHLYLEHGQYVSGLNGHKYDLDSCMSVHLLENCPILNYTHARIRKLERRDQCCYSESVQFKLGRKFSSKLIAVQGLYANGN